MKRLLYFSLFLLILSNCKKDEVERDDVIKPIVGKWLPIATEEVVDSVKVWMPVDSQTSAPVVFRPDGLPVDDLGQAGCCPPSALRVNGVVFDIRPGAPLNNNFPCLMILCNGCAPLQIEVSGNQMIITGCAGKRMKYQRA